MANRQGDGSRPQPEDKVTFVFKSAEARRATSSAHMRKARSASLSRARKSAASHHREHTKR